MGFSRQEYWSGLTYPSPGDLLHPGIELILLDWQAASLPLDKQILITKWVKGELEGIMEITTSGKQIPSLGLKEQREQRKLYKRRGALGCWNPGLWGGDIRQLVADVWGGNGREDEALCVLKKLRIGFSGCYKKSSLATGVKRSGLLWFSVASLPVRKPPEGKQGGVNRSSPESWCSSRASCWEEPGGAKMWFVVWVPRSLGLPWCKESPAVQEMQVRSLVWEDPLEEGMATHSSILPWRISWTGEPGGLQSMGSQGVGGN